MSPYVYPVAYSFPAAGAGVPADAAAGASVQLIPMIPMIPMPLVLLMMLPVPLYNDVSLPPRKHTGGQVQSPPGGTGVGRGVAWCRARVGLLYIS